MNKTRPKQLSFRVSEEEYQQLQEKISESVISKINCSLSVRRKRCKNVLIRLAVKARGSEV